jgi:hypothetical protein
MVTYSSFRDLLIFYLPLLSSSIHPFFPITFQVVGKDEKVLDLAKEVVDQMIKGCEALGLEVRAGVLKPGP